MREYEVAIPAAIDHRSGRHDSGVQIKCGCVVGRRTSGSRIERYVSLLAVRPNNMNRCRCVGGGVDLVDDEVPLLRGVTIVAAVERTRVLKLDDLGILGECLGRVVQ